MTKLRHFQIGILSEEHLEDINTYLENQPDFFYRLFFLLAEMMNFTFQLKSANTGGVLLENGTWTGLIGMLNRSEIDLAAELLFMTEERSKAVNFNYPLIITDITFVTRNPRYSSQVFAMFRIFSLPIWIAIATCIIGISTVHLIFFRRQFSMDKVVFHVLAVSLLQSLVIKPITASDHLLLCSWVTCVFFLYLCFCVVLLSFLTFPPLIGIRNIAELATAVDSWNL